MQPILRNAARDVPLQLLSTAFQRLGSTQAEPLLRNLAACQLPSSSGGARSISSLRGDSALVDTHQPICFDHNVPAHQRGSTSQYKSGTFFYPGSMALGGHAEDGREYLDPSDSRQAIRQLLKSVTTISANPTLERVSEMFTLDGVVEANGHCLATNPAEVYLMLNRINRKAGPCHCFVDKLDINVGSGARHTAVARFCNLVVLSGSDCTTAMDNAEAVLEYVTDPGYNWDEHHGRWKVKHLSWEKGSLPGISNTLSSTNATGVAMLVPMLLMALVVLMAALEKHLKEKGHKLRSRVHWGLHHSKDTVQK